MVTYLSAHEEQERISVLFKSGLVTCKSALFTLLHALITIALAAFTIASTVVDFAIGILIMSKAVFCMIRMLLNQCLDLVETQRSLLERRSGVWTSKNIG